MSSMKSSLITGACLIWYLISLPVSAQDSTVTIPLQEWLQAGPIEMPLPALHGDDFGPAELLDFNNAEVSQWQPAPGTDFPWAPGKHLRWETQQPGLNELQIPAPAGDAPAICYLAVYLDAGRWTNASLTVQSSQLYRVYLDGESILSKNNVSKGKEAVQDSLKTGIDLETGKHLLIIKTVYKPETASVWKVAARLKLPSGWEAQSVQPGVSPRHHMNIGHLLEEPEVSAVSVSADGKLAGITVKKHHPETDKTESWLELRRVSDGSLIRTYRGGMQISGIKWAPEGHRFAYSTREEGKGTLWLVDLETGTSEPLLQNVKNLGSFTWSQDGQSMFYGISDEPAKEEELLKRLRSLRDRWPGWREHTYLYQVFIPSKISRRLTAGEPGTSISAVSPDGKRLLFTRNIEDYSERPYDKTQLFLLELSSLQPDTLWSGKWFSSAQWSPDGKKILLIGGPSMFGETGMNVPEGKIPNDYDQQAYIMNLPDGQVTPVSKNFDPSIDEAFWHSEEVIYFRVKEKAFQRIYRYDTGRKSFTRLDTGLDVVSDMAVARNAPVAVYSGSSVTAPD
ncbi:MAG: hypothetical protein WAN36_00390, partial [Calditrichia bacterium]